MSATETPTESGRRGAAIRWGNPANRQKADMHDLSPEEKAVVLALIDAKKAAKASEKAAGDG